MNDLSQIMLQYRAEDGTTHTQPLSDITEAGTLIDPETGDDLELVGWLPAKHQDYVLIEGGIVQSDPFIPVFDLDVLTSDVRDHNTIDGILDLRDRLTAHHSARDDWSTVIDDAEKAIRLDGSDAHVIALEEQIRYQSSQ